MEWMKIIGDSVQFMDVYTHAVWYGVFLHEKSKYSVFSNSLLKWNAPAG